MKEEKSHPNFEVESTYHWPPDGESRPWTEFWITTLTRPVGRVATATVLFSLDHGASWVHREMEHTCVVGDQDVWHVNLGTFPAGTRIRYAVEGVDRDGHSRWDNNHGKDYGAVIGSYRDEPVSRPG